MDVLSLRRELSDGHLTPTALVTRLYPGWSAERSAWTALRTLEELRGRCAELEGQSVESRGVLWGVPFCVKDNVAVEGMATKCACKDFAWQAGEVSPVVAFFIAQGAIMVGKTNMDQFAAGLNGTRSPYGTPRNAFDERFIPGGSSSGTGALVGAGLIPFGFGTDTAGSGRVPAAFNGVVGVKGTVGLISTRGVVPAARSLDCLTIFCRNVADARFLLSLASTPQDVSWPTHRPRGDVAHHRFTAPFRFGVPQDKYLDFGGPGGPAVAEASRRLWDAAVARLQRIGGVRVADFDFAPFAETASMLYGSAFVAERVSGIRAWLQQSGKEPKDDERLEPVERVIMQSGWARNAADLYDDLAALDRNRARARVEWRKVDVLMTPTALHHYLVEELERDEKCAKPNPAKNANLGRFTNYMNLLDCCALALPSGIMTQTTTDTAAAQIAGVDHQVAVLRAADGGDAEQKRRFEVIAQRPATTPFGITLVAEAWGDQYLLDLASLWTADTQLRAGLAGHGVTTHVLAPLSAYFGAVNSSAPREEKLAAIVATFSPDCVLEDSYGNVYRGHAGIREFYSSDKSPVLKPGFSAKPDPTSALSSTSAIAVQILLSNNQGSVRVGDFFRFDSHGKISHLSVFSSSQIPK